MRIALLLGGETRTAGERSLDVTRLVTLPPSARLSSALGSCLGADPNDRSATFVLAPVGTGILAGEAWQKIERAVAILDDDAVIDTEIARAHRLLDEGWLEKAREIYLRSDALLAEESSERRVEVLLCLAEIAGHLGPENEPAKRLDQALSMLPTHGAAIAQRIEIARRAGDRATAAALGARRISLAKSDADRIAAHRQIADDCLHAAAASIRAALTIDKSNRALLERLRTVLDAAGEHSHAVDVAVQLAELLTEPTARARAFVAAAETCATRANNVGRAVALYEAAIADDPEVPGAFEAIEAVLLGSSDFVGAERAYVRHVERLDGRDAAQAALLEKLARLRENKLADRRGAIEALDRLVQLRPGDLESRAKLSALLEANNEDSLAAKCLEIMAWQAPSRTATFQALRRIFARTGDTDRAYAACSALVHLGEADLDEQLTYQQFAPEVTPQLSRPLDELDWELAFPEAHDADLAAVVLAIAPAAVSMRVEELRARKQIPPAGRKQEIERSTITAVRTVGWLARFLDIEVPDVYVRTEDVPGGIAVLPTIEPAVALGPSILSGRSVPELTFLIARELASLKMSGRLLAMCPALPDLRQFVTAAIALAMPSSDLAPDLVPTRAQLAARMSPDDRRLLAAAVARLELRPTTMRIDLLEWVRNIERTACRVGLLATGDITVAARVLAVDGRAIAGMSAAERIRDLVPFSVSQRYSGLRSALGISARVSSIPVPSAPITTRALEAMV